MKTRKDSVAIWRLDEHRFAVRSADLIVHGWCEKCQAKLADLHDQDR